MLYLTPNTPHLFDTSSSDLCFSWSKNALTACLHKSLKLPKYIFKQLFLSAIQLLKKNLFKHMGWYIKKFFSLWKTLTRIILINTKWLKVKLHPVHNLIPQNPLQLFNLSIFTVTQQRNYQFKLHFLWIIQLCTSVPTTPKRFGLFLHLGKQ